MPAVSWVRRKFPNSVPWAPLNVFNICCIIHHQNKNANHVAQTIKKCFRWSWHLLTSHFSFRYYLPTQSTTEQLPSTLLVGRHPWPSVICLSGQVNSKMHNAKTSVNIRHCGQGVMLKMQLILDISKENPNKCLGFWKNSLTNWHFKFG